MTKRKRIVIAVALPGSVLFLAAAWTLISPLFINQVVNEEFPTSMPAKPATMSKSEIMNSQLLRCRPGLA